jgi:hypothetical protein
MAEKQKNPGAETTSGLVWFAKRDRSPLRPSLLGNHRNNNHDVVGELHLNRWVKDLATGAK